MSQEIVEWDTNGPYDDSDNIIVDIYARNVASGSISVTTEICEDLVDAIDFILFYLNYPDDWDPTSMVR